MELPDTIFPVVATIALAIIVIVAVAYLVKNDYIVHFISESLPQNTGDIAIQDNNILFKTWLGTKRFPIADIQAIEGFEEVDMAVEEHSCVDITFGNGKKLLLSGVNTSHQQFIDRLLIRHLNKAPFNWGTDTDGAFYSEKIVLYKK